MVAGQLMTDLVINGDKCLNIGFASAVDAIQLTKGGNTVLLSRSLIYDHFV